MKRFLYSMERFLHRILDNDKKNIEERRVLMEFVAEVKAYVKAYHKGVITNRNMDGLSNLIRKRRTKSEIKCRGVR